MDRRYFIKAGSGGVVLCCGIGAASFLEGCTSIQYVQHIQEGNTLKIAKTAVGDAAFVVVRAEGLPAPVYLNTKNKEGYMALLMLCTHKDCEVRPTGSFLTCPCHGSEFSNKGEVLKSPADKPLATFKVTDDEEYIYIHTDET